MILSTPTRREASRIRRVPSTLALVSPMGSLVDWVTLVKRYSVDLAGSLGPMQWVPLITCDVSE